MKTLIVLLVLSLSLESFGFVIVSADLPVSCKQSECLRNRGVSVESQGSRSLFVPSRSSKLTDPQWNIYERLNACFFPGESAQGESVFSGSMSTVETSDYTVYRSSIDVATVRSGVNVRERRLMFVPKDNNLSLESDDEEVCEPVLVMSENINCENLEAQIHENSLNYQSSSLNRKAEIRRENQSLINQQRSNGCSPSPSFNEGVVQGNAVI